MEQKFVKLEDAVEMLGIPAEQLNALREQGKLRAYRDGSSWKFRSDEIETMVRDGVPDLGEASDIGMLAPEDLGGLAPLTLEDDSDGQPDEEITAEADAPEESGIELELGDTDAISAGSELELDDLEDTVTAGTSDPLLGMSDEPSEPSDSILLSEEELGESVSPSSSTIIGKSKLESADADLELASDDKLSAEDSGIDLMSTGASDVLSAEEEGSDILDQLASSSAGASGFEDLEELEIDLAAESSRILSPDDVSKAQAAASQDLVSQGDSDLTLDDDASLTEDESDMGSTDVPLLDAETASSPVDEGSGSEIELAGDDDIALSDSEGSDITLDSGDSGINLAPADSGLALDDIPLEIGGSAILSSLDLGGSDPEISLVGDVADASDLSEVAQEQEAELQTDDDFQLTPLKEGAPEDEGDSSSQVIALDADIDDLGDDVGVLDDEVGFAEDVEEGVMLSEDFGEAPADDLEMGTYAGAGAAAVAYETPYSVGQILGLGSCAVLLMLAGTMMLDMMRNIWSWDQPYSLSSSLIDSILGLF